MLLFLGQFRPTDRDILDKIGQLTSTDAASKQTAKIAFFILFYY
jgi:hypothetical protein